MLIYIGIIVLIILILFSTSENFVGSKDTDYIKLYEGYNQKKLVFDYVPNFGRSYLKDIFKINLKSIDLNIPFKNDGLDNVRMVKIWSLYNGENLASSESDFYNPYTEPDFARKANDAKYKLIIDAKSGDRIKINFTEPIKRIFIQAVF